MAHNAATQVGQPYDDQKRAAVLAALLAGQSVHQVARDYAISRPTVIKWRDAAGLGATRVVPEKHDEIGELVAGVLTETLAAVQVLARQVNDQEWLRKQPASDIAVLYGVYMDKSVRILEAFESARSDTSGTDVDPTSTPGAA